MRFYEPTYGAVVCELEYAAYLAAHRIEFLAGGGGGARTGEAGGERRSVVIDELIGESELIREVRKNILPVIFTQLLARIRFFAFVGRRLSV